MTDTPSLLFAWNFGISAVLAIFVAAISRTRFAKQRPALCHSLWLLVLVKMITPPLIPMPLLRGEDSRPLHTTAITTLDELDIVEVEPAQSTDVADTSPTPAVLLNPPLPVNRTDSRSSYGFAMFTVPRLLVAGWFSISAFLLGYCWVHVRRTSRVLRWAGDGDARLKRITDTAAEDMNVRNVSVRVVDAQLSPMIWVGWSESFIVFPQKLADQLNDEQVRHIVSHELAHYARRDQWFNVFAMFVTAVCWWHPFAWLARREIKKAQELCCDELVISHYGAKRESYLKTLFKTLELIQDQHVAVPSLASSFGDGQSLTSRFEALASGKLHYRNTWVTTLAMMLLFVGSLGVPVSGQKTVKTNADGARSDAESGALPAAFDSEDTSEIAEPLFLHWFKPTYFGGDSPPEPLMTIKVVPSKDFDLLFNDPRTAGREHWLRGKIQTKNGRFSGRVECFWKSPEEFDGELTLDHPIDATGFLWQKRYFPTRVVLTRQPTPEQFLKPETNTNDAFDATTTPVTVAAIKPSNYSNELTMSVGASLGNWLAFSVYDQSNPKEASRRNRRLGNEAIAKMLSEDPQRIDWNLHINAEKDERVQVGQPHEARFVLDLGDGNTWDEMVSLKFFLMGPPKIRNFAFRDTLSPARSFLHMEFSITHPDGKKVGTFYGGAMVRSAFYSRGILRTPGTWPQRFDLIKSAAIDHTSASYAEDDSP